MATLISLIIGCLSIGVILSAPMGPIGILTVQRTLNKGRVSGWFTGLGAAASDLFYCLLTGLGISFVTDYIEDNVTMLQILGSVILIVYAAYMIFHNPGDDRVKDTNDKDDNTRDAITGFFFTLSNPLILFLIIPLFARFGFPNPEEHKWYHIILGYILITGGALLWWTVITYAVDKVRSRFTKGSMWTINRIMGTLLLVISLYGLGSGLVKYVSTQGLL
ncbi:MAG: LysE family transporter [Muribaculaceae bacterium]|nr:LysE family transporter [Muribaculaceae bacterium]